VDSLRRSMAASWAALRRHDSRLEELDNRIGTLERRDRAENQRERRAVQAAAAPVQVPIPVPQATNGLEGLSREQVAALRDPWS